MEGLVCNRYVFKILAYCQNNGHRSWKNVCLYILTLFIVIRLLFLIFCYFLKCNFILFLVHLLGFLLMKSNIRFLCFFHSFYVKFIHNQIRIRSPSIISRINWQNPQNPHPQTFSNNQQIIPLNFHTHWNDRIGYLNRPQNNNIMIVPYTNYLRLIRSNIKNPILLRWHKRTYINLIDNNFFLLDRLEWVIIISCDEKIVIGLGNDE